MEEKFIQLRDSVRGMVDLGYNAETVLILVNDFFKDYENQKRQEGGCSSGCELNCQSLQQTPLFIQETLESISEVKGEHR